MISGVMFLSTVAVLVEKDTLIVTVLNTIIMMHKQQSIKRALRTKNVSKERTSYNTVKTSTPSIVPACL